MSYFNVRVYGLLIDKQERLLISDELEYGMKFSKFPGGGLELGEGLIDGLKREFMEECHIEVDVLSHFYTTDFYERSSFNDSQVLSVYYFVRERSPLKLNFRTEVFDFEGTDEPQQAFRWVKLDTLDPLTITFKTDRKVAELLLAMRSEGLLNTILNKNGIADE